MASTVKTIFEGDTKPQDRALAKVQADLVRYQTQRERDEQKLTTLVERQAEQRARAEIRSLQQVQREIERIRREDERLQTQRSQRFGSAVQTGAGYVLGGLAGGGFLAQQAIEKAIEQARANRLISASATEAGVAQDKLAEANKRFAASVGLSNVAAAETTSSIQRLATFAGRPQDVDKLLKAFADLGAARGLGGSELQNIVQTILSGQDEGLNRLGIADPGILQKQYAASIGKTVDALTQQEKVQAAVNAVLEKSAIFAGAAETRMNSLEGTVAKNTAAWENFTNALSTSVATSGPVTDFLTTVTGLMKGLGDSVDEVQKKLAQGQTPQQIAQSTYSGPGIGDRISAGLTAGALFSNPIGWVAALALGSNTVSGAVDPNAIYQRRYQEYLAGIQAQQKAREQQQQAASQQNKPVYQRFLDEWESRQPDRDKADKDLAKSIQAAAERQASLLLQKPGVTIPELQKGLKGLKGLGLSDLDTLNLQQDYQRKIAEEQKRQAEELKKKLEDIAKAKERLFDSVTSGSTNPFINLLGNANREMRTLLETTNNLSPALRSAFLGNLQTQNRNAFLGLRLDTRLDALSLRTQADEFHQGFRNDLNDPYTVQRLLDDQLNILHGRGPLGDQRLINLAGNLDPRLLRYDQREEVASAFEREATRKEISEQEALNFYQKMATIITDGGLKVSVADGHDFVTIKNEAPESATVTRATPAATNHRYPDGRAG